jgi:hypothetical protein
MRSSEGDRQKERERQREGETEEDRKGERFANPISKG